MTLFLAILSATLGALCCHLIREVRRLERLAPGDPFKLLLAIDPVVEQVSGAAAPGVEIEVGDGVRLSDVVAFDGPEGAQNLPEVQRMLAVLSH